MKPKIRNHFNFREFPRDVEAPTGLSLTVPNEVLSMVQIMARHQAGLPLNSRSDVYYDEDNEYPDPATLDLTEIQDLQLEHKENYAKLSAAAKEVKRKKKAEADEANFHSRLKSEGYAKNITPPETGNV